MGKKKIQPHPDEVELTNIQSGSGLDDRDVTVNFDRVDPFSSDFLQIVRSDKNMLALFEHDLVEKRVEWTGICKAMF